VKDLWNRCDLSLEWKREEVMDGVMVTPSITSSLSLSLSLSVCVCVCDCGDR